MPLVLAEQNNQIKIIGLRKKDKKCAVLLQLRLIDM